MYKKFNIEEFQKTFNEVIEKAFENDIVGEHGVTVVTESMTVYMSRQGYEEFKLEVLNGLLKPNENGQKEK